MTSCARKCSGGEIYLAVERSETLSLGSSKKIMKRTYGAWKMKQGFALWSVPSAHEKLTVRFASCERKLRSNSRAHHDNAVAASYLRSKCFILFLSKPQAWYIITAWSAVHIISPSGCISSRISVCLPAAWWYTTLRVDDMQFLAELMIYTPSAWLRRENEKDSWIAL